MLDIILNQLFCCLYKNHKLRTPPSTSLETETMGLWWWSFQSSQSLFSLGWVTHPSHTFKIALQLDISSLCAASNVTRKLCKKNSNQAASHSLQKNSKQTWLVDPGVYSTSCSLLPNFLTAVSKKENEHFIIKYPQYLF